MSACEHCLVMARIRGIEYHDQIERAEREGDPCTKLTLEGMRLRAGQFWDEETKSDRRSTPNPKP